MHNHCVDKTTLFDTDQDNSRLEVNNTLTPASLLLLKNTGCFFSPHVQTNGSTADVSVFSYCLCIGEAGGQLGLQDLLLCPLHELVAAVTAPHVNLTGFRHHGGLASLNAIWTDTGARVVWCHPTYLEEKDGRDMFTLFGIITCVWCYFYKKTDYRSLNYFYSLSSQGNNYIFCGRWLWGNSFHLGDR